MRVKGVWVFLGFGVVGLCGGWGAKMFRVKSFRGFWMLRGFRDLGDGTQGQSDAM